MTYGKTYNKAPRRINHKETRSKTNTGTNALERSVEQTIAIALPSLWKHYRHNVCPRHLLKITIIIVQNEV